MTDENYIDTKWFKLVPEKNGYELLLPANSADKKLRCASVIKPLYMWAASHLEPYKNDVDTWENLAKAAVTSSSNQATTFVWDACGRNEILQSLTSLTNISWLEQNSAAYWGTVQIDAYSVAASYAEMFRQANTDRSAQLISGLMTMVEPTQTFGLKSVVQAELNVEQDQVAVKCGWYLDDDEEKIRTHAVTVTKLPDSEILGTVVLTALRVDQQIKDTYKTIYAQGDNILSLHEKVAGQTLRNETKRMLQLALQYKA